MTRDRRTEAQRFAGELVRGVTFGTKHESN